MIDAARDLATHCQAGDVAVGHRESPAGYGGRGRSASEPVESGELRFIWMDEHARRDDSEPDISVFFVVEPSSDRRAVRSLTMFLRGRSMQVLYSVAEQRRPREIAGAYRGEERPGPRTTS